MTILEHHHCVVGVVALGSDEAGALLEHDMITDVDELDSCHGEAALFSLAEREPTCLAMSPISTAQRTRSRPA